MNRKIHLISYAHLDPVWMWNWEDGATEAVSTFRVALDFCKKYKDFVFCHGEALLYRWVEEHDPDLFKEIQKMVQAGRWYIIGGAYLQPDIHAPSGESHIRQYLYGRTYFWEKFKVRANTAWNIDSFGHAEGFVQILKGCGLKNYIFSRPRPGGKNDLPRTPFIWKDRSGSEITAIRYQGSYMTRGKVTQKVEAFLEQSSESNEEIFLWGLGNHGGGPSRDEYRDLLKCMKKYPDMEHSTPEKFLSDYTAKVKDLPVVQREFDNCSTGCYTSMFKVKQNNRISESLMTTTERMATLAWWSGRREYPIDELNHAWRQIMFGTFHDLLPGTCLATAEKDAFDMFGLCHETLKRVGMRSILSLLQGEPKPAEQVVPLFVFNPHDHPVKTDLDFTFMHSHTSEKRCRIKIKMFHNGKAIPSQREDRAVNEWVDWNMAGSCHVTLAPLSINRLEIHWERPEKPDFQKILKATPARLKMESKNLKVSINPRIGLIDWAGPKKSKKSLVSKNTFKPLVFNDLDNSWWSGNPDMAKPLREGKFGDLESLPWGKPKGVFELASPSETAAICATPDKRKEMEPVRIIEHGDVRTVVEAVFVYKNSWLVRWYMLSKHADTLEIRDRINWQEKGGMLKVEVPLNFKPKNTLSETPYSAVTRPVLEQHIERSNQRWVKVNSAQSSDWVGVANDSSYGHGADESSLYINVMRSAQYATSGVIEVPGREARYLPRQDQGEHLVNYSLVFGQGKSDLPLIHAAAELNVKPTSLAFHPSGANKKVRSMTQAKPLLEIKPSTVEVVALKRSEDGKSLVVRVMEHAGKATPCELVFNHPNKKSVEGKTSLSIGPYQIKTLLVKRSAKGLSFKECNLVEEA